VVLVFFSLGHLQLHEFIVTVLLFAATDFSSHPAELMSFASALLFLLLNANQALDFTTPTKEVDDPGCILTGIDNQLLEPLFDVDAVANAALHNFQLCNMFVLFDDDLGFWVKPRSTTWFSRFLLEQYDDHRWVQMFRMTKPVVFALADLLRPHEQKHDTKYRGDCTLRYRQLVYKKKVQIVQKKLKTKLLCLITGD
jgi:hypothetical protein